jgi:hypothetical protein
MDPKNINDFKQFVDELSKKFAGQEKFFTLKLATRLNKAAELHPHDQTIIQVASVLNKKANSGSHLISKEELNDIYRNFYITNTKCASFLSEELDLKESLPEAKKMSRREDEGQYEDLYAKYADSKLVNELESAFDKSANYKPFSKKAAQSAEKIVKSLIGGDVKVLDGSDFAVICQASFDTPKGKGHVVVPVEVVDDKALIPNMFLTQAGFKEFSTENLEDHLISTAGKNFQLNTQELLNAIKVAKFGEKEELDEVDLAVMSLKARAGISSDFDPNGIIYQSIDSFEPEISMETEEVKTFSEQLNSTAGTAEFIFGKENVNIGKNIIAKELSSAGIKDYQIKVSSVQDDSITYAVSASGCGFKVPMKVESKKIQYPNIILAKGSVSEFSTSGIKEALSSNDNSIHFEMNGYGLMSNAQLLTLVDESCNKGDINKVAELVTFIKETGDESAFKYAFASYMSLMQGSFVKKASQENKIKTIKLGGREVCAETFLPVDKVYVNEFGEIVPKYRQNMEKTDEVTAAGMMNAKIIMGL